MEDFCESIVGFLLCQDQLKEISIAKFKFIEDILGPGKLNLTQSDKYYAEENRVPNLPEIITIKVERDDPRIKWG
jgi:hypothetical protein